MHYVLPVDGALDCLADMGSTPIGAPAPRSVRSIQIIIIIYSAIIVSRAYIKIETTKA